MIYDVTLKPYQSKKLHGEALGTDVIGRMLEDPFKYFHRREITYEPWQIDAAEEELAQVWEEMQNPPKYKTTTQDCKYCDYFDFCSGKLNEKDFDERFTNERFRDATLQSAS